MWVYFWELILFWVNRFTPIKKESSEVCRPLTFYEELLTVQSPSNVQISHCYSPIEKHFCPYSRVEAKRNVFERALRNQDIPSLAVKSLFGREQWQLSEMGGLRSCNDFSSVDWPHANKNIDIKNRLGEIMRGNNRWTCAISPIPDFIPYTTPSVLSSPLRTP